jgi:hypothetical protein
MKVHTAQLAGGGRNADRVFVIERAVILLDGATAFEPNDIDPATYAEALGAAIADQLGGRPDIALADAVAAAIRGTAVRLDLSSGRSPSSTVSILRARDDAADLYVLGDSPIHYGTDRMAAGLTDERLTAVASDERAHYVARLLDGHGFDDGHRAALIALQRAQRIARNTPNGYWIAEAEPEAAYHAITRTVPSSDITWAALASDGAADYVDHISLDWHDIAQRNAEQLATLLTEADTWESNADPDGRWLPRAKRHDDKTLAAIPTIW